MNSFPSFNSDKFPKDDNYKDFHKAVQEFQQHVKSIESYGQLDLEMEGKKHIQMPRASASAVPIEDEEDIQTHLITPEEYEVKVLKWRASISQNFQSNSIWKKIRKKAKEKFKNANPEQFSGWQTRRDTWKQHAIFAHYTSDGLAKAYICIKHIQKLYKDAKHALVKLKLNQEFITEYQQYLEQVKIWKGNTKQALIYSMLARLEQGAKKEDITYDDLLFPLYAEVNQLLEVREKKEFCPDLHLQTMTPELFQKFHLAICKYTKKAERAEIAKRVNALAWFHEKSVPFGIKVIVHSEQIFVIPKERTKNQLKRFSILYSGPNICDLALCTIHMSKLQKLLSQGILTIAENADDACKSVCHIVDFYLKQFDAIQKSVHKDAKDLQGLWKSVIGEKKDTVFNALDTLTSFFFSQIKSCDKDKEASENLYRLCPIVCKLNELADSESSTSKMAVAYRKQRNDVLDILKTTFEKEVFAQKKNPSKFFTLLMALVPIRLKEHVYIVQRVLSDHLQQDNIPLLQQVRDALAAIWGKNADKILKFLIEYLVQTVTDPRSYALNIVRQYDTSLQSSNKDEPTYIVQWVSKQKNRIKEAQDTVLQVFLPIEENTIEMRNQVDAIEGSIELLRAYTLLDKGPLQAVIEHIKKYVTQVREDSSTEIRHKIIICLQDQALLYETGMQQFNYFKQFPKGLLGDKYFFELLSLCPRLLKKLHKKIFGYMELYIEDVILNIANFANFSFLSISQKEQIQLAIDKYWLTQLWKYNTIDEDILSVKIQKSESLSSAITLPEFPLTEQYKKELFDWLNIRLINHEDRADSALEKVLSRFGTNEQKQKFYALCFKHLFEKPLLDEKMAQILLRIRVLGYSNFLEKYGKENSAKIFQCIKSFFKKPILNESIYIILKNNFVVTANENLNVDEEDIMDNESYSTYCFLSKQLEEILNEQYNPIFDTIHYLKKKRYEEAYNSVKVLASMLPALGITELTQVDLHARESIKLLIKKIEEWLQEEITNDKEYLIEDVEYVVRIFQEKFLNSCMKIRPIEFSDWLKPLRILCSHARDIQMLHRAGITLASQSSSKSWVTPFARVNFTSLFELLPPSSKRSLFDELIKISLIGQSDRERKIWLLLITILRGQSDDQLRDLKAIQKLASKGTRGIQDDTDDLKEDHAKLVERSWIHKWRAILPQLPQSQSFNENTIQLLQLGSCHIPEEIWEQLFDETGTPLLGKAGCRHIVIPVIAADKQVFYYKFIPDAPGIQWMSCVLRELLWGEKEQKTFKIELAKFPAGTGDMGIAYPVLISQEVPGKTLAELWQEKPDIQLNKYSFSREFLRLLIDLEQDGKAENYITVAMDDGSYQLVNVDGEQAFTPSAVIRTMSVTGTITTQLLTKSILLCCPNMKEKIPNKIIDQFLKIDPIKFLKIFVGDVYRYNTLLLQLFSHKECIKWWNQKEQRFLIAPLREDLIMSMYTTLCRIQEAFQQTKITGQPITHIELLRKVHPMLASYYEAVLEEPIHPNKRFLKVVEGEYKIIHNPENDQEQFLTSRSSTQVVASMFGFIPNAQEAFSSHIIGADRALDCIETIVNQKTLIKQAQEELISGIDTTWKEISVPLYKEQVLNGIPGILPRIQWQDLAKKSQLFILNAILQEIKEKKLAFRALYFAYCTELSNTMFKQIIEMSPELKALDISYCKQIDESSIRQLSFFCPALRKLKIDGLSITTFSKGWWNLFSPIEFSELRYLSCNECTQLDRIVLNAPQLRVISLKHCKKLTELSLKCPNFAQANLEGCDLLPNALIGGKDITIFDATKESQKSIEIDFLEIQKNPSHMKQFREKLKLLKGVTELIIKNPCTMEDGHKKPDALRIESEFIFGLLKMYGPGLIYLNVSGCQWIDDRRLKEIITACPKLERLFCAHTKITDESKYAFYLNNLRLKVVDISDTCSANMVISTIVERCSQLETIKLSRTLVTDEGMQAFKQYGMCLKEVDISGCSKISDRGIASLLENTKLEKVDCTGIQVNDRRVLTVLRYKQHIKFVKFCDAPNIDDKAIYISEIGYKREASIQEICKQLRKDHFRYIKVLDLSYCQDIESLLNEGSSKKQGLTLLSVIKNCSSLEKLNIEGIYIHDKELEEISQQLNLLKEVNISSCRMITDRGLIALVQKCPKLKVLYLQKTGVCLEELKTLPQILNSLRKIDLSSCKMVTNDGLFALLGKCPSLEEINLGKTYISLESLKKIPYQLMLRKINLSDCFKLTDSGLVTFLQKCPDIEELNLGHTKVSFESLERTPRTLSQEYPDIRKLYEKLYFEHTEGLEKIPRQLITLRKLDLTDCRRVTDGGLVTLLQKCPNIEELNLGHTKVSLEGLEKIPHQLMLRKINLSDCSKLTDSGLFTLLQKCPDIEELKLGRTKVSLEGLEKIPHRLITLRKIDLIDCRRVTDNRLRVLLEKCPNIEELNLGYKEVSLEGLEMISHHVILRNVDLSNSKDLIEQELIALLQKCPDIEELCLDDKFGNKEIDLESLEKVPHQLILRKINISYCTKVTERGLFALLQKFPNLEELGLHYTELSLEGLEKISHQLALKKIDLYSCRKVTERGLVALLQKCPKLEEIDLGYTEVSLEGLERFPNKLLLRKIYFSNCKKVTEQGVVTLLQKCPNIEELKLRRTEVDLEGLKNIEPSLMLRRVDLSYCKKVTDLGLITLLQKCPNLEEINLEWTGISLEKFEKVPGQLMLRAINLAFCGKITEQGLIALLQKCLRLEVLNLSFTGISLEGLENIEHSLMLREINLAGCLKIDKQTILALKKKCPYLETLME